MISSSQEPFPSSSSCSDETQKCPTVCLLTFIFMLLNVTLKRSYPGIIIPCTSLHPCFFFSLYKPKKETFIFSLSNWCEEIRVNLKSKVWHHLINIFHQWIGSKVTTKCLLLWYHLLLSQAKKMPVIQSYSRFLINTGRTLGCNHNRGGALDETPLWICRIRQVWC